MRGARARFADVRRAVARLREVQLAIMSGCDEWRPPSAGSRRALPDPTASAAIRNVDELEGRLRALRDEEAELTGLIGEALVVVRAVRRGLGDKYADVLEWRYIDCMTWELIRDEHGMARTTCRRIADVAFDWIDSIGMARILEGDLEI